mmetsp:Transcript_4145/g.4061  ORF Transcript_4145/g.4061 Transcript_4145/m.4061 type:complete len:221 (-) Transcript_4145:535-1197(-)
MKISCYLLAYLVTQVCAHGDHNQANKKPDGLSWQNWHMIEEHQMDQYDTDSFFKIHDLKNKGTWSRDDILNLYGLLRESVVGDGSGMGEHSHQQESITQEAKDHVVNSILELIDTNGDKQISLDEWRQFSKKGELPDFGYGQGHHLDFETEYEEHHWNKYHANQDPDVLIKHKEDIEHELLHHEHEIEESHNAAPAIRKVTDNYLSDLRIQNVPSKYKNK